MEFNGAGRLGAQGTEWRLPSPGLAASRRPLVIVLKAFEAALRLSTRTGEIPFNHELAIRFASSQIALRAAVTALLRSLMPPQTPRSARRSSLDAVSTERTTMTRVFLSTTGMLLSIEGVGGRELTREMVEASLAEAVQHFFPVADRKMDVAMPLFERSSAEPGNQGVGKTS